MEATPHLPRPPLRHRMPAAMRAALAWVGVGLFPFVLVLSVASDASHRDVDLGAFRIPESLLLPIVAMALPTVLLRRRPLLALALMVLGAAVEIVTIHPWAFGYLFGIRLAQILAMDLAMGFITATRSRRVSVPVAAVTLCVQIAIGFLNPAGVGLSLRPELPALAMVSAWTIGNSVRARRRYADAVRSQAAAQAVTAERLRIARELHDMVAHSIGVIAIQAGVGSRVMDTQPDEARNALRTIEATSRETLAGLRRVLVGLRRTETTSTGAGERPGSAPLDPTPGLADLDRLVEATRGAGVRVDVEWSGQQRPLPADIDLSAYRIIQEAVTNVVRHAGAGRCRVTLEGRDEELTIEITDDGRGCLVPGDGYGITGMRERVGLLHGEFSAGPRAEGGFRVTARLPLPDAVRS